MAILSRPQCVTDRTKWPPKFQSKYSIVIFSQESALANAVSISNVYSWKKVVDFWSNFKKFIAEGQVENNQADFVPLTRLNHYTDRIYKSWRFPNKMHDIAYVLSFIEYEIIIISFEFSNCTKYKHSPKKIPTCAGIFVLRPSCTKEWFYLLAGLGGSW